MENGKKVSVSPIFGLELTFSGPSSFKLATSDLIFGDNNLYGQTTIGCYFVLLELMVKVCSVYIATNLSWV